MGVFRGMVLCSRKLRNQVRVFSGQQKGPLSGPWVLLVLRVRQSATVSLLRPLGQWQTLGYATDPCAGGMLGPLLSPHWQFSALGLEPSLQRLLRSIIRLLAGWSFVRNGPQNQVRTTPVT